MKPESRILVRSFLEPLLVLFLASNLPTRAETPSGVDKPIMVDSHKAAVAALRSPSYPEGAGAAGVRRFTVTLSIGENGAITAADIPAADSEAKFVAAIGAVVPSGGSTPRSIPFPVRQW